MVTTQGCMMIALTVTLTLAFGSVRAVIQGTEQNTEPSLWPYHDNTNGLILPRTPAITTLDVNIPVWGLNHTIALLAQETARLHFVDAGDGSYTELSAWGEEVLEVDSTNSIAGYTFAVYVDTFTDSDLITRAQTEVTDAFGGGEPHTSFTPDNVLVVTYKDVTWQGGNATTETNTIQLVFLIDHAHRRTYLELNYGHIDWYTKPADTPKLHIGVSRYSGSCDELSFNYEIPWRNETELTSQIEQGNTNLTKRWIFPLFRNCDSSACVCNPCPCVHGRCNQVPYGFSCTCDSGYTSATCDIQILRCAGQCQNGGTCKNTRYSYSCDCLDGVTGARCETDNRPAVGTLSSWGSWSSCSKTCDYGFRVSYRQCLRLPCQDECDRVELCSDSNCDVDPAETSETLRIIMYKSLLQVAIDDEAMRTFIATQLNIYFTSHGLDSCALVGTGLSGELASVFAADDVAIAKGYPRPMSATQTKVLFYVTITKSVLIQKCTTSVGKRAADPDVVVIPQALLLTILGPQLGNNSEELFCCGTVDTGISAISVDHSLEIIFGTVLSFGFILIILVAVTVYYTLKKNDRKMERRSDRRPTGTRMSTNYRISKYQ